jgi:hypothetical protein
VADQTPPNLKLHPDRSPCPDAPRQFIGQAA